MTLATIALSEATRAREECDRWAQFREVRGAIYRAALWSLVALSFIASAN